MIKDLAETIATLLVCVFLGTAFALVLVLTHMGVIIW